MPALTTSSVLCFIDSSLPRTLLDAAPGTLLSLVLCLPTLSAPGRASVGDQVLDQSSNIDPPPLRPAVVQRGLSVPGLIGSVQGVVSRSPLRFASWRINLLKRVHSAA